MLLTDPFDTTETGFLTAPLSSIDSTEHADITEFMHSGPDPRILNLSYSGRLDLHSCPRRYQLNKLGATSDATESETDTITFSYGHCVGLGMQLVLEGASMDVILWRLAQEWKADLWAENKKQNKSFASAIYAVQKFIRLRSAGYLGGFSLVTYKGKPACELSFIIHLPNGYKYRGYVDAVLQNAETGEIMVLECKTSSAAVIHQATYRNSAQAIGYSIVLDALFPELSSYKVLYLVYSTKEYEYEALVFNKSYVMRARWIRELILECETLSLYIEHDIFPMHGESCMDYFRECKYLGLCEMTTERLTKPLTAEIVRKIEAEHEDFEFSVSVEDLITTQLTKTGDTE